MKGKRNKPEQIITRLREAEAAYFCVNATHVSDPAGHAGRGSKHWEDTGYRKTLEVKRRWKCFQLPSQNVEQESSSVSPSTGSTRRKGMIPRAWVHHFAKSEGRGGPVHGYARASKRPAGLVESRP
jgi:hypothetical protein